MIIQTKNGWKIWLQPKWPMLIRISSILVIYWCISQLLLKHWPGIIMLLINEQDSFILSIKDGITCVEAPTEYRHFDIARTHARTHHGQRKMCIEYFRNDDWQGKPHNSESNLIQCYSYWQQCNYADSSKYISHRFHLTAQTATHVEITVLVHL
jgi:hypothetical protein